MSRGRLKSSSERMLEMYDGALMSVWEFWDTHIGQGSPFESAGLIFNTDLPEDTIRMFLLEVGWLQGMSEALGWPLSAPQAKM